MTEYYARHFRNGLPIDCGANPHNQACIDRLRGCQDVYGRKRFLVLSQMPDRYLSNAFETGGVMNAAATDIVSPDYRATAFDLLSVSIVVGYCSSAFMAPFFARENILQISGGIFILRVVWAIAIVSETLPARTYTNKTRWTAENPISSISILFRNRLFITLMALIALTSVVRKEHPRFKRFI
ncbi:hypothetical protein PC114_g9909 [Phytophthora cactorum]|nr:hypothetical protein PC114_g9909 [Phytophthora cactorum]KAG3079689.1 hypothetical protein PC121_g6913 [Phytophthora cactorum]KAG3172559.1 hypothetical protein C6341_g10238 [Phytophthora cactorum]